MNREFSFMMNEAETADLNRAMMLIEEKIEVYQTRHKVKDETYLALMCCLDLANELVQAENAHQAFRTYFAERLVSLNQAMENALQT